MIQLGQLLSVNIQWECRLSELQSGHVQYSVMVQLSMFNVCKPLDTGKAYCLVEFCRQLRTGTSVLVKIIALYIKLNRDAYFSSQNLSSDLF